MRKYLSFIQNTVMSKIDMLWMYISPKMKCKVLNTAVYIHNGLSRLFGTIPAFLAQDRVCCNKFESCSSSAESSLILDVDFSCLLSWAISDLRVLKRSISTSLVSFGDWCTSSCSVSWRKICHSVEDKKKKKIKFIVSMSQMISFLYALLAFADFWTFSAHKRWC